MAIGRQLAKHLLILINLGFLGLAIILIVLGGMMLFNVYDWIGVKKTIPFVIIGIGCLILIFACLGLYGAIKEDRCIALIYSIFMLTLLTLEVIFLFYTYYDKDKIVNISESVLDQGWEDHQNGDDDLMTVLQRGLKCCGLNGVNDYKGHYPKSCNTEHNSRLRAKIAEIGCKSALKTYILNELGNFQYLIMGVAALQIVIFALGCVMSGGSKAQDVEFINFFHR